MREKKGKSHITHKEEAQGGRAGHSLLCLGEGAFPPLSSSNSSFLLASSHPHLQAGHIKQQGRATLQKQELGIRLGGLKTAMQSKYVKHSVNRILLARTGLNAGLTREDVPGVRERTNN